MSIFVGSSPQFSIMVVVKYGTIVLRFTIWVDWAGEEGNPPLTSYTLYTSLEIRCFHCVLGDWHLEYKEENHEAI